MLQPTCAEFIIHNKEDKTATLLTTNKINRSKRLKRYLLSSHSAECCVMV